MSHTCPLFHLRLILLEIVQHRQVAIADSDDLDRADKADMTAVALVAGSVTAEDTSRPRSAGFRWQEGVADGIKQQHYASTPSKTVCRNCGGSNRGGRQNREAAR